MKLLITAVFLLAVIRLAEEGAKPAVPKLRFIGMVEIEGLFHKFVIRFPDKKKSIIVAMGEKVEGYTVKDYRPKTSPKGESISELDLQRDQEPVVTLIGNQ